VYLFVSSRSSPSLDLNTDVVPEADAAPEIDYAPDDQTLAAELPGKHPLLNIPILPILLSLMLALEDVAVTVILFLLHSLFIVICC
jgi:hypothetical protein